MSYRELQPDEVPVIGRTYLVPCLELERAGIWLPVLGETHTDPPITDVPHSHYDWRFISDATVKRLQWNGFFFPDHSGDLVKIVHVNRAFEKPELRPMECVRITPPLFPAGSHIQRHLNHVCRGMKLPAGCLTCPHRGISLAGAPREMVNGKEVIVCPGHGAGWDAETGDYTPRKL